jgi:hypothetical protein
VQVRESAGAEVRERVYVTAAEEHELSGSKGTANFVMKVSGNQAPAVAAAVHSSAQNLVAHQVCLAGSQVEGSCQEHSRAGLTSCWPRSCC